MDSQRELKILKLLDALLADEPRVIHRQTKKRAAIYLAGWAGLVVAFFIVILKGELAGMVAAVIAAIAGALGGVALFAKDAARQWPIIKPHIDQKSIAERINELEP
ncbi:hypothetical protein [uncultured Thiodictyon sp.]|uniref:hypothetical protein n=1 Tax=uncultured Thiodictyon sp. TaxID=1846217 RepID=UPI0025FA5D4F|nr:hypothetical protein [uncultured Thiodictyon sp.]